MGKIEYSTERKMDVDTILDRLAKDLGVETKTTPSIGNGNANYRHTQPEITPITLSPTTERALNSMYDDLHGIKALRETVMNYTLQSKELERAANGAKYVLETAPENGFDYISTDNISRMEGIIQRYEKSIVTNTEKSNFGDLKATDLGIEKPSERNLTPEEMRAAGLRPKGTSVLAALVSMAPDTLRRRFA